MFACAHAHPLLGRLSAHVEIPAVPGLTQRQQYGRRTGGFRSRTSHRIRFDTTLIGKIEVDATGALTWISALGELKRARASKQIESPMPRSASPVASQCRRCSQGRNRLLRDRPDFSTLGCRSGNAVPAAV